MTIKLQGVEHQLKYPIEFEETPSHSSGGKPIYIYSNDRFRLYAMHSDIDIIKKSLHESMNLIIDSYLFEPGYAGSDSALELQKFIRRCVYG